MTGEEKIPCLGCGAGAFVGERFPAVILLPRDLISLLGLFQEGGKEGE